MDKILKILAFAGVLGACVIIGIIGISTMHYEYLALLPFGLFGGITGFMYGLKGTPSATMSPPGTGGKFMGLPDWVTTIDFVLLGLGVLVIILARVL